MIAVAIGLVAVVGVLVGVRRVRPTRLLPGEPPLFVGPKGRVIAVLEVDRADPMSPPIERLVRETAARIFASMPDARVVEVQSRTGKVLGRLTREARSPRRVAIAERLLEPRPPRPLRPDLSGRLGEDQPLPTPPREGRLDVDTGLAPEPRRPVAERFDLAESVRARLRDPDDPVDVVRAILEAGGVAVEVEDDLIRADDVAVVVPRRPTAGVIGPEVLNHAYLRVARSGARRGFVVVLGLLDRGDVRRRELLAPHVLHTGPEGVQRMADAVAVGADPLRFIAGPALTARATGHTGRRGSPARA